MAALTRKGFARIFVENPNDIDGVKNVIKEIDESEYGYLPEKLIAPFSEYPNLCYTHKFDAIDMNILTAECWHRGIKIWVCDNGYSENIVNTFDEVSGKKTKTLFQ
jgi:hypothetical protein